MLEIRHRNCHGHISCEANWNILKYERSHSVAKLTLAFVCSEGSDLIWYHLSLISHAICIKKAQVFCCKVNAQRRHIRLQGCLGWSESLILADFSLWCSNMSLDVRKPAFCIHENKGADQLHGNHKADQGLCFCYMDSTILLFKS